MPHGQGERGAGGVLRRADELLEGPVQAAFHQGAVVVHLGSSGSAPGGCGPGSLPRRGPEHP
ncbi:hypothetical protein ACN24L_33555 [Streptomyces microflavus]